MNANTLTERFDDGLEPVGIAFGAFLVLVGLGTIVGTPWTTNPDTLAVGIKILGSVAAVALGAGIAYLSWTGRE